MCKSELSKKIMTIFNDLVSIRSDTETPFEKDIERYLYDWFGRLDYFKKNPDQFGREPLEADPLDRAVIWALIKGNGANTIILLNHHDIVNPFDYGTLAENAFNPKKLMKMLSELKLPEEARDDLDSGDWIFGRGTADMKSGAAIQMALIEEYSRKRNFDGNLLFISVPGEEFMSLGMINSVGLIARLKEKFNLGYQILIDSEPHQREKDCNGVIYEGTAGKLLALVYVRGKKAHVGDVFAGFNPLLLLSEIVLQTELNTGFSDAVFDEVAPPPTWMFLRDRQSVYDGSLPMSAGGCLSIISLSSKPTDIVSQLTTIIENACRKIIKEIEAHYAKYKEKNISAGEINPWEIKVKSFSDIYQMALNNSGQEFIDDYQQTFEDLMDQIQKNQKNIHESTFILIEKVLEHISILSPIVVLSFAPPYYPPLANYNYPSLTPSVSSLGDEIISFAHKELNEKYKKLNYFMQISDMSFASFHDFADAVTSIGSNMPFWDKYYGRISNESATLSMPVINIGPWGKDLHKFTERVYKPDLNERTYRILKHSIDHILK